MTPTRLSRDTLRFDFGVSRAAFFLALRDDASALTPALTPALAAVPFPAFCLEFPPLTTASATRPAEFVVVDSPALARSKPDPAPFAGPLSKSRGSIATFENLGGDATLVVPQPSAAPHATHLAVFLRTAPLTVTSALWGALGDVVSTQIGPRPVWVSTAGLGVSWLHVRLDRTPKYYRHAPYRDPGA